MEANELRIGNFIQLYRTPKDKEKSPHRVKEIFIPENEKIYFVRLYDGFKVNVGGFVPIQITPEWLEIFGFKKTFDCSDGRKEYSKKGSPMVLYYSKHNTIEGVSEATFNLKLKFVHQLQNLHFALSEKELEIIDYWKKNKAK